MEYIENWLKGLESLIPQPTEVEPVLKKFENVKALIFDIYGTLLVSSSGDIDQALVSTENLRTALKESGYVFVNKSQDNDEKVLTDLLKKFIDLIKQSHQDHIRAGNSLPEIDIREVWDYILESAIGNRIIEKTEFSDPIKLTFIFELLSNKAFPMPQMQETIRHFHNQGYPLGIVSNAQFYTPVMMNYFLTGMIESGENVEYFDPELTIFSYRLLKSKPDTRLFEPVLKTLLEKYKIKPEEAVFVGNDMYKDIYPANILGMRTVLFAGDLRSLRFRKDKNEIKDLKPGAIITQLDQLKQIC